MSIHGGPLFIPFELIAYHNVSTFIGVYHVKYRHKQYTYLNKGNNQPLNWYNESNNLEFGLICSLGASHQTVSSFRGLATQEAFLVFPQTNLSSYVFIMGNAKSNLNASCFLVSYNEYIGRHLRKSFKFATPLLHL